jgi:D-amino-acid dehydrogenase
MRVVVVGGGVIGLCTAYSLRAAGQDVTVVEGGTVGAGASWGNAGWIVPSLSGPIPTGGTLGFVARSLTSPTAPVYFRPHLERGLLPWLWRFARSCTHHRHLEGLHATAQLAARTMDLFDGLRDAGVEFDMWRRGLLFVGLDADHAREELDYLRTFEGYGYRVPREISQNGDLIAQEPALSREVTGGFLVSEERHVDPRSLTAGLTAALRAGGVTFLEGTTATGFERREGKVHGVETADGLVEGDAFVVAAGAWSGRLAKDLGVSLPMKAGKGYSYSMAPITPPTRPLYLLEAKVGVSPFDGRLRVAGTMELSGLDPSVDTRRLTAMRSAASRFLPELADAAMDEPWAGLRPLTPDGLPVIGRVPRVGNAYLATGHAMLGVTLGPATGELLTRLIVRDELDPVLAPFGVERFSRSAAISMPREQRKADR